MIAEPAEHGPTCFGWATYELLLTLRPPPDRNIGTTGPSRPRARGYGNRPGAGAPKLKFPVPEAIGVTIGIPQVHEELRRLIEENPEHAVSAALAFESLYRGEPDNSGYRQVYWKLFAEVRRQHPVTTPVEVDPPDEAWDDESHPFWTSDPYTVWDHKYRDLGKQFGWVLAHLTVSALQAQGDDL